jgi:hypothetical protein
MIEARSVDATVVDGQDEEQHDLTLIKNVDATVAQFNRSVAKLASASPLDSPFSDRSLDGILVYVQYLQLLDFGSDAYR